MSANEESAEPRIPSMARLSAFIVARGFRFPTSFYGNGETKFPSLPRFYINLSFSVWRGQGPPHRRASLLPCRDVLCPSF